MIAVAVGWQVYSIHENPLDLGLIGLAEFLPLPLLALPAGHIADRLPAEGSCSPSRSMVDGVIAALLLVVTLAGANVALAVPRARFSSGVAAALGWPASRSLPPMLVSADLLASADGATARSPFRRRPSSGRRSAACSSRSSPSSSTWSPRRCSRRARVPAPVREPRRGALERGSDRAGPGRLLAGLRFVRRTPVLLGAISLDLVAVLFGGAMALLPLFAKSILDTGRSASASCAARPPSARCSPALCSPAGRSAAAPGGRC